MCLAKNIRFLRKSKGYSQDYIAEKLGYKSYTTIQKWEMGISEPSIATLRTLADLFDVDINDMTSKDLENPAVSIESKAQTVAAHFDGNEFTDDELDEIQKYIDFVKSRRNK